MKHFRLLHALLLYFWPIILLGQSFSNNFSSIELLEKYFSANLQNLDIAEGIYDVTMTHRTGNGRGGNDSFQIGIVRNPSNSIFTIYIYSDGRLYKSEHLSIEKSGENNAYLFSYVYSASKNSARVYIDNTAHRINATIELDRATARYFANNPYFGYSVTLNYNCLKKFPTSSMYSDALRKSPGANPSSTWTGTGFALNSKYVVTNYHVVENARTITLKGVHGNFSTNYSANVEAIDKSNDLALLKLNGNVSITNIPYSVKTIITDVGEEVFVLGYPLTATMGDEIKLTTGVISSKSGFQGDVSQYQISAPVQPGNSGGPLFDSKGNVIGIVSAKHAGAENVGYAIKSSYLRNLVESVASSSVLPQTNRVSNQNLSGKVKAVKNYIYYITCTR